MHKNTEQRVYELTERDFKFVVDIVYRNTGIVLGENKREMVYRRLMRCVRSEKLDSIQAYCNVLRKADDIELNKFFNAITTNLTNFYREAHHFEFLKENVFPNLLKENQNKRIRIWSSACSTGEEPYTLGITLIESLASLLSQWDAKILATDIDSDVLAKAKQGIYSKDRVDEIPKTIVKKWFHNGIGKNDNKVKIDSRISNLITFKKLNLLHQWPMKGPFDVIFCRNVLIYFDKETQESLIERYYDMLTPNGYLMLGHSENLSKNQQHKFKAIGRTIFQKI